MKKKLNSRQYRGRKSKYRKKLDNPQWRLVRQMILKRDDYKCRICGRKQQLEVHHLRYYVDNKSIVGNEINHLNCLILLCSVCHSKIHNKKL